MDASHTDKNVTRRGHTGFIVFLNREPIIWHSKIQNTVKSRNFSSEFIEAKSCVEHITSLHFKLRMLRISVVDSTKILCDNESVVNNFSIFPSTLNENHISIAYHFVMWNLAAGVIKVTWIDNNSNLADAMKNRLTTEKRGTLFGQ